MSDTYFIKSLDVAEPIRSEHRVYRKALVAFIVPKHVVLEELIGLFGLCSGPRIDCRQSRPTRRCRTMPIHQTLFGGVRRASRTPMCSPAAGPPPPSVMALFTIGSSSKFAVFRLRCCAPIRLLNCTRKERLVLSATIGKRAQTWSRADQVARHAVARWTTLIDVEPAARMNVLPHSRTRSLGVSEGTRE